jgi:DNA-directed RNA polymerase subunit RPC12/RpoP
MGTTKRYCVDCGSRLVYYPNLSNPKAPNEYRLLVYTCMNCSEKNEKPTFIAIKRNKTEDPILAIKILIQEETK